MFIPKANSKQKCVKKTQEHEIGDAVTVQLASRANHLSWRVTTGCCREKPIFHPKIPILNPLSPNLIPWFVQTFINTKRGSKPYKTWTKTSFWQNHHLTHFYKIPQEQDNFTTSFMIMITQSFNHQQKHLITTTTTIRSEFINNSSTTTLHFTNFEQKHKYTYIHNLSM